MSSPLMIWRVQVQIPSKETCASKDRMLPTWLHETLPVLNTCPHESIILLNAELTQGDRMPRYCLISDRYLFTQLRTSSAKEMARSSSHGCNCSGPSPLRIFHTIYNMRQLCRPLAWQVQSRNSDQPQIREETESPHLMNYRNKSVISSGKLWIWVWNFPFL